MGTMGNNWQLGSVRVRDKDNKSHLDENMRQRGPPITEDLAGTLSMGSHNSKMG